MTVPYLRAPYKKACWVLTTGSIHIPQSTTRRSSPPLQFIPHGFQIANLRLFESRCRIAEALPLTVPQVVDVKAVRSSWVLEKSRGSSFLTHLDHSKIRLAAAQPILWYTMAATLAELSTVCVAFKRFSLMEFCALVNWLMSQKKGSPLSMHCFR